MNKKEIIITSAKELFTKYGYKKVSMDEVAKKSGVTKKTIYSYFQDKESLFKTIFEKEIEEITKKINLNEDSKEPFFNIVTKDIYYMLEYRKHNAFLNMISNEIETLKFLKIYDDKIINYIEEKLKKEIKLKNIKPCDTHLTAFILYKIYIAIMFEYEEEINEEKVTNEVCTILKEGLLN